jgi:hypothetical protein
MNSSMPPQARRGALHVLLIKIHKHKQEEFRSPSRKLKEDSSFDTVEHVAWLVSLVVKPLKHQLFLILLRTPN